MGEGDHEVMRQSLRTSANRRRIALAAIAIVAGSVLGYASLFTDSLTNRVHGHPTLFKDVVAMIGGGTIGLFSAPVVVLICYGKNLRIGLPVVYGVSLIVVVLATILWSPLLAVALGFIALVGACFVVNLSMSRTIQRVNPGKCGWCGYDIASGQSTCCPECGQDCDPDTMSLASKSAGPVLGETWFRKYWMQTSPQRACIIAVFLLALVIGASRYLSPHFSPARFENVRTGMSMQEVRHLLGRPDLQSVSATTNEQMWVYEQGSMVFGYFGYCLIGFSEGQVTLLEIDGW